MSQITINNVNGAPPYNIYVCDFNQYDCELVLIQTTNIPPAVTINIPTRFKYLPVLLLKIIDSSQCEFIETYNCQTLTPTPSFTSTPTETPTNTPTPSITPSITPSSETPTPTPTISITPSETPTNTPTSSITPSITKTPTITPSITSSVTPTPTVTLTLSESVTPTPTVTLSLYTTPTVTTSATPTITPTPTIGTTISFRNYFLIFAEPSSGSTGLAEYMASRGSTFYGFSNGSSPSTNQVEFERQMNLYMSYSGFTNSAGGFRVYTNVDYENEILYGNPNVDRNFRLTKITANTLSVNSWYTIFIFTGFTLSQKQSTIGIGLGQSDYLTSVNTNSDFYNLSVYYTGGSYIQFATYRVYTTFPSSEMFLNNENLNIFFKGLNLT